MKGDFTRSTFKKENHYNSVRMQQGRVQMDADWNEQMDIQAHLRQTEALDVIGRTGVPKYGGGFKVDVLEDGSDFRISPGRIYVDGILCELETTPVTAKLFKSNSDIQVIVPVWIVDGQEFKNNQCIEIVENSSNSWLARVIDVNQETLTLTIEPITPGIVVSNVEKEIELFRTTTYFTQPDFPEAPEVDPGDYLVYLDVWQRHITALDDEYIREKALGGPDTATRVKTLWQVKLQSPDNMDCHQIGPDWLPDNVKKSRNLSARAKPEEEPDEPCTLLPQAGYRRLENQLYRVEIHKSGTADPLDNPNNATFKWSRNNGSITAKVEPITEVGEIEISHPVPGRLDEFVPGQWVELTDENHELKGEKGVFLKILEKNGEKLTIETHPEDVEWAPNDFTNNPKVRSWDSVGTLQVHIPTGNEGFIKLEGGVEVKFEDGQDYQSGDYWLIPARSATGDIEWPKDKSDPTIQIFKAPDGIKHHYCQLALVNFSSGIFDFRQDCRDFFPPLNEVTIGKGCCTITVGDGNTSHGDTNILQDAIDQVQQGGQICLLPGVHEANVTINGGRNITINGCGNQARIIPGAELQRNQPIFTIENSQFITLENIDMTTFGGTALQMQKGTGELKEIQIIANNIVARDHAVRVLDGKRIKITGNKVRMMDREEGEPAIFMKAEDSIIENNDICVVPAGEMTPPHINGEGIPDLSTSYDNDNLEEVYNNKTWLSAYLDKIWDYMLYEYPGTSFTAPGGIQVAGESEEIKIKENRVRGGYWNGITLGHIPLDPTMGEADYNMLNGLKKTHYGINQETLGDALLETFKEYFVGFITNVEIEKNEIKYMGLNGIGVVNFFSLKEVGEMVTVDELTITGNTIVECLQQIPTNLASDMSGEMALAGIALADGENLTIRENRIDQNGTQPTAPVCGIFIRHGERIDISDNRILNNGPKTSPEIEGVGGGIVIMLGIGKMIAEFMDKIDQEIPLIDGVPAVKIHDNIVSQPLGKALTILALGPVSVVGNHLTSQGIDSYVKYLPYLAGAVLIVNLGVSRDLFMSFLIAGLKSIMNSVPDNSDETLGKGVWSTTQPLYFSTAGPLTFTNLIAQPANFFCMRKSWDTIGKPPADVASVTGTKLGPVIEFLVYLPTGSVLFADNQATLDLRSKKLDFAISSQLIFSLDDISYVGNQSECNSRLDVVLTDVFTLGNTIRTNDNRFQEGVTIAFFSLVSIGLMMNTWTGNQATHCLTALGIRDEAEGNNLVRYKYVLFDFVKFSLCKIMRDVLRLLLRPRKKKEIPGSDSG